MVKRAGAVETGQAGGAGEPELVASFCAAAGTSSARTQTQASRRQRRFMKLLPDHLQANGNKTAFLTRSFWPQARREDNLFRV